MKLLPRLKRLFSSASTGNPAFGATGRGRMRNWIVSNNGPNTEIIYSLDELRRKSRDLTRNFAYMNGAYETVSANIVGPGINVMPRHEDCTLCSKLKELWDEWCLDCDISGTNDFQSLLSLAVRERWEAGEVFLRFVPVNHGIVPFKLQLLSSEQCKLDENHVNEDGGKTIAGIRFDKKGQVQSYVFYVENPTESLAVRSSFETIEIPVEEICHYFKQVWVGQVRGVPEAFSGMLKIRDMLEYDEAELNKKKTAAMMAGFVTSDAPEGPLNEDDEDPDAGPGEAIANITSGTIVSLAPGEDIKFNPPVESGSSYEPFMNQNLRAIANVLQLTYEEFSNDMSKANFSSIRAGLNITQRKHRQEQNRLIHQIVRPVWEKFVEMAILSGAVDVELAQYNQNRRAFFRAKFQPAGWPYVNPQQEVAAQKEKVLCGFSSRAQIIAENGGDAAEVDAQINRDAARAADYGLVFATDPTLGKGAPIPSEKS